MKKIVIGIATILIVLSGIGCASTKPQTTDYLLCNNTSMDDMAETESGFFHLFEKILYYADKEDMTTWVPVCNKADCSHKGMDCNAYVGSEIAQKGEKLYFVSDKIDFGNIGIYEVSLDGSGRKQVYEIPLGVEEASFRGLISSSSLILSYTYLTENGMYQSNIDRLEEDGTLHHLYSETNEEQVANLFMSGAYFFVRGKEVILSSRLTLKYTDKTGIEVQNVLWTMDGEKPELVTLPDDVSIGWCYLSEDSCIDFGDYDDGKGYYEIDLESGKKTFLGKSQQENAWGYILTEECVVESNRYLNQAPEDAYLRIYHNGKWLNVSLPDVVTNVQLEETSFLPVAVASDRIFFKQDANGNEGYSCRLYYVMLDDETPELTYCTTFGSERYFQISEESESIDWQDLDITVYNTEEHLIKVTGVGLAPEYKEKGKDVYKITMYCENKTSHNVRLSLSWGAINGVQLSNLASNYSLEAGESKEHVIYIDESLMKHYNEISDLYNFNEYTDISFLIFPTDPSYDPSSREIFHIYPQGEENATTYVRESESTDEVLIDNEYVTVTIVGYETTSISNDTAILFIENKSDEIIAWVRDGIPTVNGVEVTQYIEHNDGTKDALVSTGIIEPILPHCSRYTYIELPKALLEENNMNSIENWEVILRFWDEDAWANLDWDDALINETFTISPTP